MTNILTAAEAANTLRTDSTDPAMLDLLAQVDAYIRGATGRDWTADATIHPVAKGAARMLLALNYDNPSQMGLGHGMLPQGLTAMLTQLESMAARYKTFHGISGSGGVWLKGAVLGDTVSTLTGLIGTSGDRRADFESVITVSDQIQQLSTSDLSDNYYRVYLTPVSDL